MTERIDDATLARRAAARAGELLMDLRESGRFEGKELGKEGDARANAAILSLIAEHRPKDGVLSEESKDSPARLASERVWIIDPLDGTREYGEGREDWAVHVALTENGAPVLGAVALPAQGSILESAAPQPLAPLPTTPRMLISRSRPPAEALRVAGMLGAELVEMGSAGAKAMAVVQGKAELYVHSGGQYEWDNCAPVAVALAAGLYCARLDGAPLVYNRPDPYLPDLVICRMEWRDGVVAALAEIAANRAASDQ